MEPKKFIAFEGIDKSGKSTQIELLATHIKRRNKYQDVLLTREPTWRATHIRGMLERDEDPYSDSELISRLYVQDRSLHFRDQISPEIAQNSFVLTDRYAMSTLAYQTAQGESLEPLLQMHEDANIMGPEITFLLTISPETFERRLNKSKELREKFETREFVTEVQYQYDTLGNAATLNESPIDKRIKMLVGQVYKINGERPPEEVQEVVQMIFEGHYP